MAPLDDSNAEAIRDDLRWALGRAGAWLFAFGLLTGLWAGLVLTGKVHVAFPRLALGAHLTAMLGGLWLIALAWSLDFLRYGARGQRRLAWLIGISVWANWSVTLVASALGVRGLEYTREPLNNVIAALLDLFVVVPALAGAFAWAWGFGRRR
jgi:(hydroxyamino)benzene mutase